MSISRSSHQVQVVDLLRFDLDEALACCSTTAITKTTSSPSSTSSKVVSEQIPTVTVGADSVCCVCMESFIGSPHHNGAKQLPCGHVYHPDCILTWISSSCNNSCPLCRHIIF